MPSPIVLSGTVHDELDTPIGGARAYVRHGTSPVPDVAALTDGLGRFTLAVQAPGTFVIECAADGFTTAAVTIDAVASLELPALVLHRAP